MVEVASWAKTPWPSTVKMSSVPKELRDLPFYAEDKKLLARWNELLVRWHRQCPGVNVETEVNRAHEWEVDNPQKRKTNKVAFLNNWMRRAQDRAARFPGAQQQATHSPISAKPPVDGLRLELLRTVQSYDGMVVDGEEITSCGVRRENGIVPWAKVPTHRLEYLKLQVELCGS
jgi:hypothetical protein